MSQRSTLKPLFSWRHAISDSPLEPTTRHVALALSLYMSERGDSAHPGANRLAHDTGLSSRCVRDHLAVLVDKGWLTLVSRGGLLGERRHSNVYEASIPEPPSPVEADDPGTSFTREPDSPVNLATPTPEPERALPLNVVHPNSSENSPENSPSRTSLAFEAFWQTYPPRNGKRIGKGEAEKQWAKLTTADQQLATLGAANLADAVRARLTLAPDAHRWLRKRSWEDWQTPAVDDRNGTQAGGVLDNFVAREVYR